jgi:hypothetical protein
MQQVRDDPMGPYGRVLRNAAYFSAAGSPRRDRSSSIRRTESRIQLKRFAGGIQDDDFETDLVFILEKASGIDIASSYQKFLQTLDKGRILIDDAAFLVIDPQRSFTQGVWMQSMGDEAAVDVKPIAAAFKNCSRLLNEIYGRREIMFTRCPFPPGSYDWDDCLAEIIDDNQLYFIKPGNNVLLSI